MQQLTECVTSDLVQIHIVSLIQVKVNLHELILAVCCICHGKVTVVIIVSICYEQTKLNM